MSRHARILTSAIEREHTGADGDSKTPTATPSRGSDKLTSADGGRFAPAADLSAGTVLAPTVLFHAMRVSRARAAGVELKPVVVLRRLAPDVRRNFHEQSSNAQAASGASQSAGAAARYGAAACTTSTPFMASCPGISQTNS